MEKAIIPAAIASAALILVIILFSGRKARKLDASNPSGLHKPKDFVRLLEIILLLLFCAAAFVTIERAVGAAVGLALMGLTLLGWIPLQFWQSARLLTDEIKITYVRPSGRIRQVRWREIREVDTSSGGLTLRGGGKDMRIPAWFSGLDKVRETIVKNVKNS